MGAMVNPANGHPPVPQRHRRAPGAALLLAAACALPAGCAVPQPAGSTGVDAAAAVPPIPRWDVLADDIARRTADKTRAWHADAPAIHVVPSGASAFHLGLRSLLVTRLRERGVAVSVEPTGVELRIETQLLQPPGTRTPQLLVSTSLENDGRYLARTGDFYAVPSGNAALYAAPEPAAPMLRMVDR